MSGAARCEERSALALNLRVEWSNGNQKWVVLGGGLPANAAWNEFDRRDEALAEALLIADDLCVEVSL